MADDDWDIFPPYKASYIESMMWHTESAMQSIEAVGDWIPLVAKEDKRVLELPKESLLLKLIKTIK